MAKKEKSTRSLKELFEMSQAVVQLQLGFLKTGPRYGRLINHTRIEAMSGDNFNPNMFEVVTVRKLGEDLYEVVEGNHRITLLQYMELPPDTLVWCKVVDEDTAYRLFIDMSNGRQPISKADIFWAKYAGGESAQVKIVASLEEAGLKPIREKKQGIADGEIFCVDAFERLYDSVEGDVQKFEKVLACLREAFPSASSKQTSKFALSGDFIRGIASWAKGTKYSPDELKRALTSSRFSVAKLKKLGSVMSGVGSFLDELIYYHKKNAEVWIDKVNHWNQELGRLEGLKAQQKATLTVIEGE